MFAKELLLQCMVKSVDVLEGILDGFLAISTDISQTAKALGPSPSTYAYLKGIYLLIHQTLMGSKLRILLELLYRGCIGSGIRRGCSRWLV